MRNIKGNLWHQIADAVCITTNGCVQQSGRAVMGKGLALQATQKWPNIAMVLGALIKQHGNRCMVIDAADSKHLALVPTGHAFHFVVSFPTKPGYTIATEENIIPRLRSSFKPGNKVPGWACKSDIELIKQSAKQLVKIADHFNWEVITLSRPGCGNGELSWTDVEPVLTPILDDRFHIVSLT